MVDEIRVVMRGIREAQAEFRQIERRTDRATMYAVRQGGRVVRQISRRTVRVYRGPRPDKPKGRLKKSISSSRRLATHGSGSYGVTVAPRGFPATAYAGKIEELDHFMTAGHDAAAGQLTEIAATAWVRAARGRR